MLPVAGFLMTFLRKYSYSAVGFNYLISALVIQVCCPRVRAGSLPPPVPPFGATLKPHAMPPPLLAHAVS